MNVFTLTTLIVDSEQGETAMSVAVYSSLDKAKKDFDNLVEEQSDIFDDSGRIYAIDRFYNEGTPESEMTDDNCFALSISNEHGLSVQIEITEMPVQ